VIYIFSAVVPVGLDNLRNKFVNTLESCQTIRNFYLNCGILLNFKSD